MRFLFRGFDRTTGKPLEGHVEASDTEAAYQTLSDHGIVTEALHESASPPESAISQFAEALESALDSSSSQVAFDDLSERYSGKKVWVVDRRKIRRRVAEVVDSTLATSVADLEIGTVARQRVAEAISDLFEDKRNIATENNAQQIAKMRQTMSDSALADQIGRLSGVVEQAEGLIAAMQAALRNADSAGPRRRRFVPTTATNDEQNEVLREIFQSNLDLRRAIVNGAA